MTVVGAGGIVIRSWSKLKRFHKDYDKLSIEYRNKVDEKLQDLVKDPRPAGLRFEKLEGYSNPEIYTIHIDGNYKASMEIDGDHAALRRAGNHNEIDRTP